MSSHVSCNTGSDYDTFQRKETDCRNIILFECVTVKHGFACLEVELHMLAQGSKQVKFTLPRVNVTGITRVIIITTYDDEGERLKAQP